MRPRFHFDMTPNGPPLDAVVPRLLPDGSLECPKCKGVCRTPVAWSPWSGIEERMVLVAGKTCDCPHCRCVHLFPPGLALAHNRILYPDDPQYQRGG
jgi:hypothetical protein